MHPSTISGINRLPEDERFDIYTRVLPPQLFERFRLPAPNTVRGRSLIQLRCGASDVEIRLYHEQRFPDPLLYGHLTDTLSGQIHILLYILNDPDSPRFNVDILPDGRSTRFGTQFRNLEAEQEALQAGLAPGQVRRGLRLLPQAIETFERFVLGLGHKLYFVEPLYYHNAVIFERYGFAYQQGRRLMESIEQGFAPGGPFRAALDSTSPFRHPATANSIRLRSWAIHDGLLGQPFTNVTMYKQVGKHADINTCPACSW